MSVLTDWDLQLDAADVLRGQGGDPVVLASRRPELIAVAENALIVGRPLLHPVLITRSVNMVGMTHDRIRLSDGILRSKLLAEQLGNASRIEVCLVTIGSQLEDHSRAIFETDPLLGIALDGLGNAAISQLTSEVCGYFDRIAAKNNEFCSIPISPGSVGWSVAEGQPDLFRLLPEAREWVDLTETQMIIPVKSGSFVIGISASKFSNAETCSFCDIRETCRYQGSFHHG